MLERSLVRFESIYAGQRQPLLLCNVLFLNEADTGWDNTALRTHGSVPISLLGCRPHSPHPSCSRTKGRSKDLTVRNEQLLCSGSKRAARQWWVESQRKWGSKESAEPQKGQRHLKMDREQQWTLKGRQAGSTSPRTPSCASRRPCCCGNPFTSHLQLCSVHSTKQRLTLSSSPSFDS